MVYQITDLTRAKHAEILKFMFVPIAPRFDLIGTAVVTRDFKWS